MTSFCIRCGKKRVLHKTWVEKGDGRGSKIKSEKYACPDRDCQREVDKKFDEMREKRLASEEKRKSINLKKTAAA